MPKQKLNEEARLFRRLLHYMPENQIEQFKLEVLLKEYAKVQAQLVLELGEAGAAKYEAQVVHEIAPQLIELGLKIGAGDKEALR